MSTLEGDDLRWALQRRIEDVFAKLGEKFGDLTGRVETDIRPSVSFAASQESWSGSMPT